MPIFDDSRSWFRWDHSLPTVVVDGYTFAYDQIDSGMHIYVRGQEATCIGKFFCYLPINTSAGVGRIRAAIKRHIKGVA